MAILAKVTIQGPLAKAAAVRASVRPVLRLCNQIQRRSKALTPVDTGNLRASEMIRVQALRTRVTGRVYTKVKYGWFVHEGTPPHEIRPRRKKALKFKIGGRTVIVTKVNHPGTKPRPFLRTAVLETAARYRWLRVVSTGG